MQNTTETLGIGSRAPDFRLSQANGPGTISLSELVARRPLVLEFLRGTWCHSCRKRMVELEKLRNQPWMEGGQLVCIAAEKREGMWEPAKFLQLNPLSYPFLLDEDRAVIKAYGLYHRVGIDAWNIAHPATLVLDRSARVRYIYKGSSQSDRAPMEEVMKALRKVSALSEGASA
jgi:methyl-accepting chemotaxis protein